MRGRWWDVDRFGFRPAWDAGTWLPVCLVALCAYLVGLGGLGLFDVSESRHGAARSNASTMMLEVPAGTSSARLATVLALLKQTPGIVSARAADAAETARLLEPWLGPGARLDELPVPKLVDIATDPSKTVNVAALRQRLGSVVPDAQLDDDRLALQETHSAGWRIMVALGGAVGAGLLGIAAVSVIAQSMAPGSNRTAIEVMHLLGATDWDIAHHAVRRVLSGGLAGGALGAAAAAGTAALLGVGGFLAPPMATAASTAWQSWAIIVAIVPATALIAAATSYVCVRRRLLKMP